MQSRHLFGLCTLTAAVVLGGCREREDPGAPPVTEFFPDGGVDCPEPGVKRARGGVGGATGAAAVSPNFSGSPVQAESAPPPISGGTLHTSSDGTTLIAADPDRDAVYIVDVAKRALVRRIELQPGDEPGRLVEDAAGKMHVALRGGGAIASFGLDVDAPVQRLEVCDLPRGLAYSSDTKRLYVACAEGKLVEVDPSTSRATRKIELGRDLRDVLVRDSSVFVTRFRSAELLEVSLRDGTVMSTRTPPPLPESETVVVEDPTPADVANSTCHPTFTHTEQRINMKQADVAWRTIDVPGVGIAMLHQRAGRAEVQVQEGGYGGGSACSPGIVNPALSIGDDMATSVSLLEGGLLVDLSVDPTGRLLAIADPGRWQTWQSVMLYEMPQRRSESGVAPNPCQHARGSLPVAGQATAVSFVSPQLVAVQEREPAAISFFDVGSLQLLYYLDLKQPSRSDTGHTLFHLTTSGGIACASCHAEAGDDGHIWSFHGIGPRRTQTLRGGILGTEPFHWNGDMKDFAMLVDEVFVGRMSGPDTVAAQAELLAKWIDAQPSLQARPNDMEAVARGKTLFESEALGCATCHNGVRLSNNESADVGTGAKLQVPSLRAVSFRAPFMHDGCASTLADRFGQCGGGDKHGRTSQLSAGERGDVVAYLESL